MTLGSFFDGVGTWQLAAVRAGIKPVWSSEIDAFACTVATWILLRIKEAES